MRIKEARFLSVLLIIVCVSLSACSGGKQPAKTAQDASPGDKASSPGSTATSPGITIAAGDEKTGVKLPESYPKDVFPLYEGSHVLTLIELDGGVTLTAFSKDDVALVIAFYEEILKDAKVTADTRGDGYLTSLGTIGNYSYSFDTGPSDELEGYKTSIAIMLTPTK